MVTPGPVQEVRFCEAPDGVGIAYAVHGSGPPLLIDACWLSHLQFDWQSPVWRHYLVELGRIATVIRYDERGSRAVGPRRRPTTASRPGSPTSRRSPTTPGFDRFALLAMAQGGPVAIEYAARHPERLTRLVFYGSYAGARPAATPEELELDDAFEQLIKVGWARPTSEFRRVFTCMMIPGGDRGADALARRAAADGGRPPTTAVLARSQRQVDRRQRPLAELDLPTLVLHSRGDQMNDFERRPGPRGGHRGRPAGGAGEQQPHRAGGRAGLAGVPARGHRVPRPGPVPRRPPPPTTWPRCCRRASSTSSRLAAEGRDNDAIAAELVLSRPHRRAAPAERLREARAAGPDRAHGGRSRGCSPPTPDARLRVSRHRRRSTVVSCASAPMRRGRPDSYGCGHQPPTGGIMTTTDHTSRSRHRRGPALKAKHAAMWASGSYRDRRRRGRRDRSAASSSRPSTCSRGQRVLDVAAGTGTLGPPGRPPRRRRDRHRPDARAARRSAGAAAAARVST